MSRSTKTWNRREFIGGVAAAAGAAAFPRPVFAADPVRIGLVIPKTGPFASTGHQVEAGCRLYLAKNGDTVAGRTIELIVRDDTGTAPELTKRIAQELVVRDNAHVLAGFGLTPLAFAAAPVATETRVPMIVMAAATSSIPQKSPYIVRSGFTLPQVTAPLAEWAAKNGIRTAVSLVSDYGPGIDAEKTFVRRFTEGGGTIAEAVRAPLANPDFAPFVQRAKDAKADALFVFVPSGAGTAVMKQYAERGLRDAGTKLICTGDVVDDDILDAMGAPALGVVSSHHYSAAHPSAQNKAYVAAFMQANAGMRPNFMSVGGYDGMHVIHEALTKTRGDVDGDKLVAAMKGMTWESPRGPMSIDAATRDVIQDVYIRKVERVDGKLFNVEFATIPHVKDPGA
ncbi:MAG TPA: ABC transporter substrate-binding protein [Casimicrobiaceae bacterium]|nr:ABC transporter substrate-binding protein [Casimicrobiaceae bacterium]